MAAAIGPAVGVGTSLIGGLMGKGAQKKQQQLAEQQLRQLQPLINAQVQASQYGLNQAQQLIPQATSGLQNVYDTSLGQLGDLTGDYRSLLNQALGRSGELYESGKGLMGEGRDLSAQGRNLLTSSLPYLQGASTALGDLQKFYRPFMDSGQRAIDKFLPSAQRTNQLLAPEFGNINQGYRSASENIARFAPRGGGRVSTLARADIDRQKQLSDTFFKGREGLMQQGLGAAFQGAQGQQGVANALQALGLGQGQLGLGTIGQGLNTTGMGLNTIGTGTSLLGTQGGLAQNSMSQALQSLGLGGQMAGNLGQLGSSLFGQGQQGGQAATGTMANLYNQQANRAYGSNANQGQSSSGLGGFLVDLFNNKGAQSGATDLYHKIFGQPKSSLPNITFG